MNFIVFVLCFIPLGLVIGLSAATVGMSAWTSVFPLLWIGFSLDIYEALFVSVVVDATSGITLLIFYSLQRKIVSYIECLIFSLVAVAFAFLGAYFSHSILSQYGYIAKRGMGYLILLIAVGFIRRGYVAWKATSIANSQDKREVTVPLVFVGVQRLVYLCASCLGALSGFMSGLVGFGSGLNFTVIFLLLLKKELINATAHGTFVMGILMTSIAWFYGAGFIPLNLSLIWKYLAVAIPSTIVGNVIGATIMIKVSKVYINFVVALLLFIIGLYAIIQPYLLKA
eukprot:TRINITY_DN994_c1_g1_i1.p1 TRINITY_DN994_c1_g1~~TRINITY_DN994_c1_g1_i1.p1  ORF type:complete len:284 (-),score=26.15 TRINITY_DN994_c1_g1_i1:224-1075(-)